MYLDADENGQPRQVCCMVLVLVLLLLLLVVVVAAAATDLRNQFGGRFRLTILAAPIGNKKVEFLIG